MFTFSLNFFEKNLTITQLILFNILKKLMRLMDIPLFPHFPLMNFGINFKIIIEMAFYSEVPQKFIDFSLDASEWYYDEYNYNSEILYYSILLYKSPKKYKYIFLFIFYILFFKTWKINFLYWTYAISLPFIFLAIFLYIDYLDGYFD